MKISLKSKENVLWYINDDLTKNGDEFIFAPSKAGIYKITAKNNQKIEQITIIIEPVKK